MLQLSVMEMRNGFSSPLGDIYFSIIYQETDPRKALVLVPSRGYLFLNYKGKKISQYMGKVLVPSRGYLFLNDRKSALERLYLPVLVPSRGYLFLNHKQPWYRSIQPRSRPLSGISISQCKNGKTYTYQG